RFDPRGRDHASAHGACAQLDLEVPGSIHEVHTTHDGRCEPLTSANVERSPCLWRRGGLGFARDGPAGSHRCTWSRVTMATTDPTLTAAPQLQDLTVGEVAGRSPWQIFWTRLKKDRAALVGASIIIVFVLIAVLAPVISHNLVHHGPNDLFQDQMTNELGIPKGPNAHFWFGADRNGRDVFVRSMYGLRTSLIVAIGATGIAVALGSVLGLIAGFVGGWDDILISRAVDIVLALPLLLFAIGLAAACSFSNAGCLGGFIKPGLGLILFIIAVFSWPYIARIIRGQALSIR